MAVPVSQAWTVATYVLKQKLMGRTQALSAGADARAAVPLQSGLRRLRQDPVPGAHPENRTHARRVLQGGRRMRRARWFASPAASRCCIRRSTEIVDGLVARKKYIYLCTNALLLKEKLDLFKPSKYLTFSVHVDGQREHHDFSVCREGGYDIAMEGIAKRSKRGFRVTTNTTLFDGADPEQRARVLRRDDGARRRGHDAFARLHLRQGARPEALPGHGAKTRRLFRAILSNRKKSWQFNQSPAVPRVPDGQAELRLHAVGHADVQHLRLAEAVLPACRTATPTRSRN